MHPETMTSRPCAADIPAHVASFVTDITVRTKLPLNYSIASLKLVDRVVDGIRTGTAHREQVADTLFSLGAYAGETLVRQFNAQWVDLTPEHRTLFAQPVGIRMPDTRLWNPIGKVFNRFDSGPPESLHTLYLTLHGRTRLDP